VEKIEKLSRRKNHSFSNLFPVEAEEREWESMRGEETVIAQRNSF